MIYSIIIPVYNEDLKIFRQVLESIKEHSDERLNRVIIAVDGGNEAYVPLADEFGFDYFLAPKIGKRKAMYTASQYLDNCDIVLVNDSDTIWTESTLNIMLPFENEKVGGVTGRHWLFGESKGVEKLMSEWLEAIRFDLVLPAQHVLGNVTCLPGRLMAYRTKIFIPAIKKVADRVLFGSPVNSGDDRDLTTEVIERGYKAVYESSSNCLTGRPETLKAFAKQQLRWYRSTIRETMIRFPFYITKMPLQTIFSMEFAFSSLALLGVMIAGLLDDYKYQTPFYISIFFVITFSFIKYSLLLAKKQNRQYIVWLPIINLISFFLLFPIKLYAFATWFDSGWLTRKK